MAVQPGGRQSSYHHVLINTTTAGSCFYSPVVSLLPSDSKQHTVVQSYWTTATMGCPRLLALEWLSPRDWAIPVPGAWGTPLYLLFNMIGQLCAFLIKWGKGGRDDQVPKVLRHFLPKYWVNIWILGLYKSYLMSVQNEGGWGSRPLLDNVQKKDTFYLMASLTTLTQLVSRKLYTYSLVYKLV